MIEIGFYRTKEVKMPQKYTTTDIGIDFFIPKFSVEFREHFKQMNDILKGYLGKKDILISPFEDVLIPMGLKPILNLSGNYGMIFFNKSGVAVKKRLIVGACVIDPDYRGEIFLHLINTSTKTIYIEEGEKIIQGKIEPMEFDISIKEFTKEEFEKYEKTERGEGALGSSGRF